MRLGLKIAVTVLTLFCSIFFIATSSAEQLGEACAVSGASTELGVTKLDTNGKNVIACLKDDDGSGGHWRGMNVGQDCASSTKSIDLVAKTGTTTDTYTASFALPEASHADIVTRNRCHNTCPCWSVLFQCRHSAWKFVSQTVVKDECSSGEASTSSCTYGSDTYPSGSTLGWPPVCGTWLCVDGRWVIIEQCDDSSNGNR